MPVIGPRITNAILMIASAEMDLGRLYSVEKAEQSDEITYADGLSQETSRVVRHTISVARTEHLSPPEWFAAARAAQKDQERATAVLFSAGGGAAYLIGQRVVSVREMAPTDSDPALDVLVIEGFGETGFDY